MTKVFGFLKVFLLCLSLSTAAVFAEDVDVTQEFIISVKKGDIKTFNRLKSNPEVKLNETYKGNTALAWAIWHDSENLVAELLELEGIDVTHPTVINVVFKGQKQERMKQMLAHETAQPNALLRGFTSWQAGRYSYGWNWLSAEFIQPVLEHKDLDINKLDVVYKDFFYELNSFKSTYLSRAIKQGRTDLALLLINNPRLDINTRNVDGSTAIMQAGQMPEVLAAMMNHQDIDINAKDDNQNTVLMRLIPTAPAKKLLEILDRADFDNRGINHMNKAGSSALSTAVAYQRYVVGMTIDEHVEFVKKILAIPGVEVNNPNSGLSNTPLMLATSEATELLLSRDEIEVNAVNKAKETALIQAARQGNLSKVNLLLAHSETQVDLLNQDGHSAVMVAKGQELTNALLKKAKVLKTPNGQSALSLMIVGYFTPRALAMADRFGFEPSSTQTGDIGAVEALLADSRVDKTEYIDGKSMLMLAIEKDLSFELIKTLANSPYLDVNTISEEEEHTALIIAAGNGRTQVVKMLLDIPGLDINYKNKFNEGALEFAVKNGHVDIMDLIYSREGFIRGTAVGQDPESRFVLAAYLGDMETLNAFISDEELGLVESHGAEALTMAFYQGQIEVIKRLFALEPNLIVTENNKTMVSAIRSGKLEIVEILVAQPGVEINALDARGRSSVYTALVNEQYDILEFLLSVEGVDPNIGDALAESAEYSRYRRVFDSRAFDLLLDHPMIDLSQSKVLSVVVNDTTDNFDEGLMKLKRIFNHSQAAKLPINQKQGFWSRTPLMDLVDDLDKIEGNETAVYSIFELFLSHPKIDLSIEDERGRTVQELIRTEEVRKIFNQVKEDLGL